MSVINKMLRDLDDRQASGTLQVRVQDGRDGIARDTQSIRDDGGPVKVRQDRNRASPWLVLLAVMVLLVGGAAGWWYQSKRPLPVEPTVQLPAPQAPESNPVATPAAVSLFPSRLTCARWYMPCRRRWIWSALAMWRMASG